MDERALTRHGPSHGDLEHALRQKGVEAPAQREDAWLERNGDISIVKTKG